MKVTVEMIQEFNKLYIKGYTMQMLGDKYGLSKRTVCNYIWNRRKGGTVIEMRGNIWVNTVLKK